MNNLGFKDEAELFGAILRYPNLIALLPISEKYNKHFISFLYEILGDEILPFIPTEMIRLFKKNKVQTDIHIPVQTEEELLHNLLTDIETINQLTTNEKYNDEMLEMLYIIYGNKLIDYIPYEMFEQLKNDDYNQKRL